jgi:hypothetical protein
MAAAKPPAKPTRQEVCPGVFLSTLRSDGPLRECAVHPRAASVVHAADGDAGMRVT